MGGTTSVKCSTFIKEKMTCEQYGKQSSSQGGYSIKDLKCDNMTCRMVIETDGVSFDIESTCPDKFDMDSDPGYYDKYENCYFRRNFELYSDGSIEYKN